MLSALERYGRRHASLQVERRAFLAEELPQMVAEASSTGRTPAQTVSRVLQELRDDGRLFFSNAGVYVLEDALIEAQTEDFPDDVLEHAAQRTTLRLADVPAGDAIGVARFRRGMSAVRRATLANYGCRCALCDIGDAGLLVSSHIARWADAADARGSLANVICMCRLHDPLFEAGYFTLSDQLDVLWRPGIDSAAIRRWAASCTGPFRLPVAHAPAPAYLQAHRSRVCL